MSTDLDAVIRNVAKKNGVGLYRDDPVMVLVTIINQLTEDQQAGVVAALDKYREVHSDLALRWQADAARAANRILNAALDAGREEMAKGMSAGAAQVVRIVNEANASALAEQRKEAEKLIGGMKRFAYWMLAAAGAIMLTALFMAACL
jgi:CHASE3 domain sensor protein